MYILTKDLSISDLPRKMASWKRLVTFSSSFAIDRACPDASKISGFSDLHEDSSLLDYRVAFYCEWRRWNHFCDEPDSETMKLAWKRLEEMRELVAGYGSSVPIKPL